MFTWPAVLKFMAASATFLGVSVVTRRRQKDEVSPFAGLISTFGLIIMAVALVFLSGIETIYVLVAGACVCIIGFFLERIARLGRLGPDVELDD